MAKIKINGDSSGYVEIAAPNAAHNNTLELGPGTKILTDKNTHSSNIGIGTDIPYANSGSNLHIHSANNTSEIRLTNSTTGGGNNGSVIQQGGNTLYISNSENSNTVFETNGSEKVRITAAGDMGLGTNSPNTYTNYNTLTINGTTGGEIDFEANGTLIGDIFANASGLFLNTRTQDPIVFSTYNGSNLLERLRISSDGKVNITTATNTASPATGGDNLVIKDSDGSGISILSGDGNSQNIYMGSTSDNDGVRLEGFYNSGTPYFKIYTGGSERLRIDSAGKVSLGGSFTPGATLHIRDSNNTTKGAAQLKISKGIGGNAAPTSISRADCYIHLGGSEWGVGGTGIYLMGLGYTNGETGTGIPAYIGYRETSSSGYTLGDLVFGTRGNTTGTNNPTERLRITSAGDVGIGEDSPVTRLHLANSGSGNVSMTITNDTTGHTSGNGVEIGMGADEQAQIWNYENSYFRIGTNNVERFRITSTGQISVKHHNTSDQLELAKSSGFGYDQNTYRVLRIGKALGVTGSTTYQTLAFNYDPSGNSSGAFSGHGNEILVPNHDTYPTAFMQPKSNNSGYNTCLSFGDTGEVRQPSQPSFAAYRNQSTWSLSANDTFVFNVEEFDVGGGYDTSNGRYTAPIAGKYLFTFYTIIYGNVTNGYVQFYKNGARINIGDTHFTFSGGNNWDTIHYTRIISLAANDYVYMRSPTAHTYHGANWSGFMGYMLG